MVNRSFFFRFNKGPLMCHDSKYCTPKNDHVYKSCLVLAHNIPMFVVNANVNSPNSPLPTVPLQTTPSLESQDQYHLKVRQSAGFLGSEVQHVSMIMKIRSCRI